MTELPIAPAEPTPVAAAAAEPAGFPSAGPFTGAHLEMDINDPASLLRVIQAQQMALAQQLTAEEVAELRELREMRRTQTERALKEAAEAAARLTPPTHYVHLADGSVVEGSQLATHHTVGDGTGHPSGDRIVKIVGSFLR